jgi:superfamily II DNA helicase RecQ
VLFLIHQNANTLTVNTLPFPILEYIQATGRGGRDGQLCHCVLFFSPLDIRVAKNVLQFWKLGERDKERLQVSLDNVCKVCI